MGEFGGSFELTEGLAQNVLIKRKGTTGKVEPCPKILKDEKLMFERAISKFFSDPDIALELVLNLDQIPLSYVLPEKYTFDLKGSKTDPFKDVHDIRYHLYL